MKWSAIFLCVFSMHSMVSMENDFLNQICPEHVQKVKKKIENGTGPKKMLNFVDRSCGGNLALKAYALGKTWRKTDFCADPLHFFIEISQQAKQCNDQLAIQVSQIMQMNVTSDASLIHHAIQLNAERGLGFLIQLGESLSPEHLSLAIQKEKPHLTTFLLKAGCPVELWYTLVYQHPLVVAVKKRDTLAVRMLLPKIKPNQKFICHLETPTITIQEYLNEGDLNYIDEVEELGRQERILERLNVPNMPTHAIS